MFANKATDKGLISNIYKQLMQLNIKKSISIKKNQNVKDKSISKHFSEKDIQMIKKHMERYSASLVIREMQIKTLMVSPHTKSEWPSSKNL